MKKMLTLFGSLMIIAGLKAQKEPSIKKETSPAAKVNGLDSMTSKTKLPAKPGVSKEAVIKENPVNSVPHKITPVVKPEKHNPVALPEKQSPVTKPTKQ